MAANDRHFHKPIIIACTAFVDLDTKTKCYDLKMDSFIAKPVRKLELETTLRYFGLIP
jgi:CheY-like chemotaxis protein